VRPDDLRVRLGPPATCPSAKTRGKPDLTRMKCVMNPQDKSTLKQLTEIETQLQITTDSILATKLAHELLKLPGIGEKTARRIMNRNGWDSVWIKPKALCQTCKAVFRL